MDESHRWELRAVIIRLAGDADDLGLRHAEVARLLGLAPGSWPLPVPRQWPWEPEGWQESRLRHLAEICRRLNCLFGADAAMWFRRENRALRTTPLEFLLAEHGGLRMLRDALREEAERV